MEILSVHNLLKVYKKGSTKIKALDNVSFSVKVGEFIAILGPTGAGKSTLFHVLNGFSKPNGGFVVIKETDIFKLSEKNMAIFRRRNIGQIYQTYNLFPELNVEENITLPLTMDGGKKACKDLLDEILDMLGLNHLRKERLENLSGVEQQKVSIGRAMINKPGLILADEPTGNLDEKNSNEVFEFLKFFNEKYNQTFVVSTRDEKIAIKADRIIFIEDGLIMQDAAI